MSRLDAKLDTHKDAEVRLALEPLVRLADVTGAAILGLIHVNKSMSTDPLTTLMASRAFAAVARAVLFAMKDPDDETLRLLGQPKNNLGRVDLPTLTFRIQSAHVADTDEGPVFTGRIEWVGESDRSITEALESASETAEGRSAVAEAADWLLDHLASQGGTDDSAAIRTQGGKAGHAFSTLKRARTRIKAISEPCGFPRRTFWTLPSTAAQRDPITVGPALGRLVPLSPLGPTGYNDTSPVPDVRSEQSDQKSQWAQSDQPPTRGGPTGPQTEDCPVCTWPYDSLGHTQNCGTAGA
jgi:G:T/U-mismatch repair DNA glycosylase